MSTRRFKSYPAYKDSGVEWLGEIPVGWEVKRLKQLAALNPDSLGEETDPSREMVYVDIGGVDGLGRIVEREQLTFATAPSRARRLVRDGDVIVSTVRTYLRAIAPIRDPVPDMVVSTGFAVVRPAADLTTDYAAYALRAPYFVERVVANSKGVSFPAISESEMATYEVAAPPQPEQRAIAAFLDRETARMDALVTKKERLIELLQEERTALITRAVTKGLDPNVRMKDSGVEWLGDIPAHWPVYPLGFRYDIQLGKMLDSSKITGEHLRPYLRVFDVQWGAINTADLPEMDFDAGAQHKFRLAVGDLLVNEGGSYPGRSAIWRGDVDECYYQKALHRLRALRPSEDSTQFLYYVMYWAATQGAFIAGGNETTIEHLPAARLRRYRFAFPPEEEQRVIAAFLDRETARIDTLITKVRDAINRLTELRTALISAAVTGKIDVREEVA